MSEIPARIGMSVSLFCREIRATSETNFASSYVASTKGTRTIEVLSFSNF